MYHRPNLLHHTPRRLLSWSLSQFSKVAAPLRYWQATRLIWRLLCDETRSWVYLGMQACTHVLLGKANLPMWPNSNTDFSIYVCWHESRLVCIIVIFTSSSTVCCGSYYPLKRACLVSLPKWAPKNFCCVWTVKSASEEESHTSARIARNASLPKAWIQSLTKTEYIPFMSWSQW